MTLIHMSLRRFTGSTEERQVYEKAQHHNKLQKRGEEPGLRLKVSAAVIHSKKTKHMHQMKTTEVK